MALQRRPVKHDIDLEEEGVLSVAIIISVIVSIIVGLSVIIGTAPNGRHTQEAADEHNVIVEEFNSYPAEMRETLRKADYSDALEWQDETALLSLWEGTYSKDGNGTVCLIASISVVTFYSLLVFIFYCLWHDKSFYLASFPRTARGIAILVSSFPFGFIPYAISFCRMRHALGGQRQQERVTVDKLPEISQEMIAEELSNHQTLSEEMIDDYRMLSQRCRDSGWENKVRDCKNELEATSLRLHGVKSEITQLIMERRELREQYKRLKSDRAVVEEEARKAMAETLDAVTAATELEAIRTMRGVQKVRFDKAENGVVQALLLDVFVRVPHEGYLYDFGDYVIRLWWYEYDGRTRFKLDCGQTRVIFLANREEGGMYSRYRGKFCFGAREDAIQDFLAAGDLIAAISVMLDSMFSVNSEHEVKIAKQYPAIGVVVDAAETLA